ncbi:MAG: glycosyltransferase family 4 protein [Undibacterium sp.]
MRLLILTPFYPPHIGGLETHALEFNQHVAPLLDCVTVFTPRLPVHAPIREIDANLTVLRFPAYELIHNYPIPQFWRSDFWKLWREALASQPTHVLSRTRFFFTSLMAWRIARSQRLPWLHVEHGSDFVHFHSSLKSTIGKVYDWIFGRFVLQQADRIVANSRASAAFVAKLSGRDDCQTIYRGVEIEKIIHTPDQTEVRERFPDRVIIGYLGRLIDGKGVVHILEALKTLNDTRLACVIIGSGSEKSKLETYIKEQSLEDSVILLGHRPLPEALGLMKSFDIFINPSYSEGIPTSVIEAALLKKAIIATDVGGTPEIITGEGDGFLIPAGNVELLCEKLRLLVHDHDLRRSFGERAYESVQGKFSWPNAIRQYLEIFETLSQRTK